jgi:hypothetical protein
MDDNLISHHYNSICLLYTGLISLNRHQFFDTIVIEAGSINQFRLKRTSRMLYSWVIDLCERIENVEAF